MTPDDRTFHFDDFRLDVANRQLWRGDTRVELTARYFDALVLLVREHGQLVEKDRFFDEVWDDVVVSDAALTQCIKDIRKQLGDAAANPRYIQTVPRYGYRFIAPVEVGPPATPPATPPDAEPALRARPGGAPGSAPGPGRWAPLWEAARWGSAGTLGGGLAGVLGGLLYGSGLAYGAGDPDMGTASVLLVLLSLNVLVGLVGGFGVGFGMAAGLITRGGPRWSIAGAALGGLVVGSAAKLLGVDAFNLLFGRAPMGITGGPEGAALGGALALGAWLGGLGGAAPPWRPVAGAGLAGAVAGVLIPVAGGRLMGGSLELLARSFAGSRLELDALGRFFGEVHFGFTTQVVLGGIEGLLFGGCVAGAVVVAQRAWPSGPSAR